MHTRLVTFVARLTVAFGILLALPAPAMAVDFAFDGPASVNESAGSATYTVTCGDTLGLPNAGILTVAAADGPAPAATAGDDYTPLTVAQTAFTCPPLGESTIVVPILNDAVDEGAENFTVSITGALLPGGAISESVTTTITDDDPVASIAPVALVLEGNSGTSTAELVVTLASAAAQATTIGYSTESFSAQAGSDFTAASGDLVIPVGRSTGTISIPIIGDTAPESHEAFYVNLLTTNNGSLDATKRQGAIGIFNDDKAPLATVSIVKSASTEEGDRGTGNVLFNVTLSAAATERTEVKWKTGDWTADKGADYKRGSGKVVFQAGQKSKTISVDVIGDRRDEPDEAFTVTLENPVAAVLGTRKAGFGIIEDDDGPKMRIGKPRVRGKRLVTKIGCPNSADGCTGRLVGKSGGLKLGRKKFDLASGEQKKLRLKLSREARSALAERRRRAKLIATASDSTGDTRITKRKARLRRLR